MSNHPKISMLINCNFRYPIYGPRLSPLSLIANCGVAITERGAFDDFLDETAEFFMRKQSEENNKNATARVDAIDN